MAFTVLSISTITAPVARAIKVAQRAKFSKYIYQAGVYNCRKIDGTNTWSQHSWGNAVDLFTRSALNNKRAANGIVYQTTHRTIANKFKKLDVYRVIDHENSRDWVKGAGWTKYGGAKGLHVHVEGDPVKTGTPPCA